MAVISQILAHTLAIGLTLGMDCLKNGNIWYIKSFNKLSDWVFSALVSWLELPLLVPGCCCISVSSLINPTGWISSVLFDVEFPLSLWFVGREYCLLHFLLLLVSPGPSPYHYFVQPWAIRHCSPLLWWWPGLDFVVAWKEFVEALLDTSATILATWTIHSLY